ncbi:glutathione s-transferase [Leptolyngbya sp. Heron Island J]|uniref:glutathione S-transferase family protein n=1 Tax=Leptolyngbya sp. Heron Island J TaxID=1385935 RepID=UPI0003B9E3DA|nr:glutathione S-transferase family protein [Leptolyngbya sp. Heron Island J]ESA33464.1 glutathione s-transferase [Leptolyngbya sp. Heron Island J]
MLTFYYHPLSPISRRVWLALLEKEIPFKPVVVDLPNKEHLQSEFLALNPFHHVPVIQDNDFRLIESLAILDYLELKYPEPTLVPSSCEAIATMKMLQLVIVNELMPKISQVIMMAERPLAPGLNEQLHQIMQFLEAYLVQHTYFGGDTLNLADIVAGATIPLFQRLGFSLAPYPVLSRWCQAITTRPAWKVSSPSDSELEAWQQVVRRWIRVSQKRRQRQAV